jgi:hypothetical protein
MSEPLASDLIRRIESLEKSNSRWRITSVAALGAVAALLVWTAHSYPQRQPAPRRNQEPAATCLWT